MVKDLTPILSILEYNYIRYKAFKEVIKFKCSWLSLIQFDWCLIKKIKRDTLSDVEAQPRAM